VYLDFVYKVPVDSSFAVLGSGGMAKAVVAALRNIGFHTGTVVARNPRTGAALAERYGYAWRAEVGASRPQLLVNATPVGMSGGPAADDLLVAPEVVDNCHPDPLLVRHGASTGQRASGSKRTASSSAWAMRSGAWMAAAPWRT
jgi:shikimate 5-dehydrogenase